MNADKYLDLNSTKVSLSKILLSSIFVFFICSLPFFLGVFFSIVCYGAMLKKIIAKSCNKSRDMLVWVCAIALYLLILFLETRSPSGGTDGGVLLLNFQFAGVVLGAMLIAFWLIGTEWRRED